MAAETRQQLSERTAPAAAHPRPKARSRRQEGGEAPSWTAPLARAARAYVARLPGHLLTGACRQTSPRTRALTRSRNSRRPHLQSSPISPVLATNACRVTMVTGKPILNAALLYTRESREPGFTSGSIDLSCLPKTLASGLPHFRARVLFRLLG